MYANATMIFHFIYYDVDYNFKKRNDDVDTFFLFDYGNSKSFKSFLL